MSGKTLTVYGGTGTFFGLESQAFTPSGHSVECKVPTGWDSNWRPGKTMGWTEFYNGKLFICGQDLTGNGYRLTGTEYCYEIFDTVEETLNSYIIPTSTGSSSVISGNGVTGGAYGADVALVRLGRKRTPAIFFMSSFPYQNAFNYDWDLNIYGIYPELYGLIEDGQGNWQKHKVYYSSDFRASGGPGIITFPQAVNTLGQSYVDNRATSEIDTLPRSQMIVSAQYFLNHDLPYCAGAVMVIDPNTGTVLASYAPAVSANSEIKSLNVRGVMVDPSSTLGNEVFAIIYDTFKPGGGDAGYNTFQVYSYDHNAKKIKPLSNILRNNLDIADHWTNGTFDDDGWLWFWRRKSTAIRAIACFPKYNGSIKPTKYPYKWSGILPQEITPDIEITLDSGLSYGNTRLRYDSQTKTIYGLSGNLRIIALRKDGPAHSTRVTALANIDTGYSTYIQPSKSGIQWPMDSSIDVEGRAFYGPLGFLDDSTSCPSYPCAPHNLQQYLFKLDIEKAHADPHFVSSVNGQRLVSNTITANLPSSFRAGDLVVYEFMNGSSSTDAVVDKAWSILDQESNGFGGMDYILVYRIMDGTETDGPTLTWGSTLNIGYVGASFRGVEPSNPINAFASTLSSGSTTTITRPSVTPTVADSRIIGFYGFNATVDWTIGAGEEKITEHGISGGANSVLMTQEMYRQSEITSPQTVTADSSSNRSGAFTIALTPISSPEIAPDILSVEFDSDSYSGGIATGTITLTGPSPAQGCFVTIEGSSIGIQVPYTLYIPPGASSAVFTGNVSSNVRDSAYYITVSGDTNSTTSPPVEVNPLQIDFFATLNSVYLSEHNRGPLDISSSLNKTIQLANAESRVLCVESGELTKKQFSLNWTLLPEKDSDTVDGRAGRWSLRDLSQITEPMNFTFVDSDGSHGYNVYVDSYEESITRRYETAYYWDVSLTLTEV